MLLIPEILLGVSKAAGLLGAKPFGQLLAACFAATWSMLGASRDTLRLEWIVAGTPSVRYSQEGFHPCAIVCSGCTAEQASLRNLDRQYESSGFTIYMNRSDTEILDGMAPSRITDR